MSGPTSSGPTMDIDGINAELAEATKRAERIASRNRRLAVAATMPVTSRAELRARDDEFRAIASEFEGEYEYEFEGDGRKARRDKARFKLGEWLNSKLVGAIRIGKRKAARQGLHSRGLRGRSDASRARRAARMAAAAARRTARSVVS